MTDQRRPGRCGRVLIAAKRCVNEHGLSVPFPITTLDVPEDSPLLAVDAMARRSGDGSVS